MDPIPWRDPMWNWTSTLLVCLARKRILRLRTTYFWFSNIVHAAIRRFVSHFFVHISLLKPLVPSSIVHE